MAGLIAKLLSFTRTTKNEAQVSVVKVDRSGGDIATLEHFADSGDDSFPLPSDYVAVMPVGSGKRFVANGYLDPINAPKATAGEKRIKARDASTGADIVDFWLKSDGTAVIANSNGSFTLTPTGEITGLNSLGSFSLQANGDFLVNGVKIDTMGNITSPTSIAAPSIVANSKEIAEHVHLAGTPPGDTGVNK